MLSRVLPMVVFGAVDIFAKNVMVYGDIMRHALEPVPMVVVIRVVLVVVM